jgi:DNA primase
MAMEVDKARKNRQRREKREQEKVDLAPARNLQPKSREIRYDDVKSARAEETLIAMAMKEPALMDLAGELKAEAFSVPLFARVYSQMRQRHSTGLGIGLASLEELSTDEASHIAMVTQKLTGPVNEGAFRDCVELIRVRHRKRSVSSDEDLMALRNKKKESGGYTP